MYEDLIKRLRNCTSDTVEDCDGCPYQGGYKGTYCMNGLVSEAANAIEELSERIAIYEKAEVDGRMIILPVKEGTPLYVDGKIFAAHCKGEIHEVKDWYYSFPMIYKDFRGEHDYAIDPDSIGHSVFLTKEEAVKNLKRKTILTEPPKEEK